ncbi:hypothetical protein [Thiocapsa rosea]|uniref:TVP38/TMEM64 family membrane protein n=1 Tax=Thiocapsa rosea TaxID=69360 RepID=A0A495V4B9_9GAMM|nr:hypothetical protein [Thiocapsa rosea]RKT44149.1 putative membrane protein YdjX (TVP38/TMEM64 family) [Thiocapsa rosea]
MSKKSLDHDHAPRDTTPLIVPPGCGAVAALQPVPGDRIGRGSKRGDTRCGCLGRFSGAGRARERSDAPKRRAWVVWSVRLFGVLTLALIGWWLWIAYDWDHTAFWEWTSTADPLAFFLLLAVLPAIGFPTSPFYLLAGATFGAGTALVGSGLGMAANLVLCWWLAHTNLRPWIQSRLARTSFKLPELTSPAQAIRFALLVKAAPGVPGTLKTYLLCLSGLTFPVYFWVSLIVSMIYAAIFILLGESVLEHDFRQIGWMLLILALLGGLVWWIRQRWRRQLLNS